MGDNPIAVNKYIIILFIKLSKHAVCSKSVVVVVDTGFSTVGLN